MRRYAARSPRGLPGGRIYALVWDGGLVRGLVSGWVGWCPGALRRQFTSNLLSLHRVNRESIGSCSLLRSTSTSIRTARVAGYSSGLHVLARSPVLACSPVLRWTGPTVLGRSIRERKARSAQMEDDDTPMMANSNEWLTGMLECFFKRCMYNPCHPTKKNMQGEQRVDGSTDHR